MSTKMGIYYTFNTMATMQPIKRVDMVVNVGSKFAINSNCLRAQAGKKRLAFQNKPFCTFKLWVMYTYYTFVKNELS